MSLEERKAWPGTLVDPCLLSGCTTWRLRREKEAADKEQPIGTSGIMKRTQFLANGKGFFFVKIS
jgi:hypothetical protein